MSKKSKGIIILLLTIICIVVLGTFITVSAIEYIEYIEDELNGGTNTSFNDNNGEGIYKSTESLAKYVEQNRKIFLSNKQTEREMHSGKDKKVPIIVDEMMGKSMKSFYSNSTSNSVTYRSLSCIDANHRYQGKEDYSIHNIIDIGYANNGKSVDVYKGYTKDYSKTRIENNNDLQRYSAKMAAYMYSIHKSTSNLSDKNSILIRTLAFMCRSSSKLNNQIYMSSRPYDIKGTYSWIKDTEDQYLSSGNQRAILNKTFKEEVGIDIDTYADNIVNGKITGDDSNVKRIEKNKNVTPTVAIKYQKKTKSTKGYDYILIGPMQASGDSSDNASYIVSLSINGTSTTNFKLCNKEGEEWSNQSSTLKNKIQEGKNFYIKYNYKNDGYDSTKGGGIPADIKKIKVKCKQTFANTSNINNTIIRARLVLVTARPTYKDFKHSHQNLAVFNAIGKKVNIPENSSITWNVDGTIPLKIKKIDENGNTMAGVTFDVYKDNAYLATVTTEKQSDEENYAIMENVQTGYYYVQEMSTGNSTEYSAHMQYYPKSKTQYIDVNANNESNEFIIEMENKKYTNLAIHKTVKNNPNIPIANVAFKVQYRESNQEEWKYVIYNDSIKDSEPEMNLDLRLQTTTDENQATVFTTNINGYCYLDTIRVGEYRVVEISVPEPYALMPQTPNGDGTYTLWENNTSNSMYCGPISDIQCLNSGGQRPYIYTFECADPHIFKISGYVFTPNKAGKDEQSVGSHQGMYYPDSDKVVSNATVKLNRDGQLYQGTSQGEVGGILTTDQNGWYEYVIEMGTYNPEVGESEYVNRFSVQFEYDGIDFLAMSPNYQYDPKGITSGSKTTDLFENTTSKATEHQDNAVRTVYDPITGIENPNDPAIENKGYGYIGNNKNNLTYTWKSNTGDDKQRKGTSVSEVNEYHTGYTQYDNYVEIKENNKDGEKIKNKMYSEFTLNGEGKQDGYRNTYKYEDYSVMENGHVSKITQVNLGIITREMPDLAVSTYLDSVSSEINGFTNVYAKRQRKDKLGELIGSNTNLGVTYVDHPEIGAIYKADAKTVKDNPDNDNRLKMYITYKIDLENQSQTVFAKAHELALFYDPNYELISVSDELDGTGKAKAKEGMLLENSKVRNTTSNEGTYNIAYVNTSNCGVLQNLDNSSQGGNIKDIYVTYRVKDDEIKNMLNDKEYMPKFKNLVEINSYTAYEDKEGTKVYAGIDKDSAPGNVPDSIDLNTEEKNGEMTSKFDDDTGYGEEFTISLKDDRTLEGQVFLDATTQSGEGQEKLSDGKYDESKGDYKVKLEDGKISLLEVKFNNKENLDASGGAPVARTKEDEKLEGVDPSIELKDDGSYKITGFIPGYYVLRFEYNNKTYYIDQNGNHIDINALDYQAAKLKDDNITAHQPNGEGDYTLSTKDGNLTWYKSDNVTETDKVTGEDKIKALRVESSKKTRYTEVYDNWVTRNNLDYENINYNTTDPNYKINESMDSYTPAFAIQVELNTLSKDNTYLPEGYNIFNMDFGITERAKQDIEIRKKVSNIKIILANGQVLLDGDPSTSKKMSGLKYISPSEVTDPVTDRKVKTNGTVNVELDSELIHGSTLELTYTIRVHNKSEKDFYNEAYYKYGTVKSDEVTITPEVYDYVDNDLTFDKAKNNDWEVISSNEFASSDENKLLVSGNALSEIQKHNTIIHYNGTAFDYTTANSSPSVNLVLSRVLSNTNDDLSYDNDVEIVKGVKHNKGRRIEKPKQVGTYKDKEVTTTQIATTPIGASSETTTITPPTGEDKDYTIYIIIGAVSLLILATGIIIIKKKVLK